MKVLSKEEVERSVSELKKNGDYKHGWGVLALLFLLLNPINLAAKAGTTNPVAYGIIIGSIIITILVYINIRERMFAKYTENTNKFWMVSAKIGTGCLLVYYFILTNILKNI